MTTATLCPSCGETVAEEDDFCESCGTRLHSPPPQEAVHNAPLEEPGGYVQAPSTTLAAVVVVGDQLVAANVGDSRAYWIDAASPEACRLLSHDDSLAEAAIAAGASPEEAYARRDAHTITHWLGTAAPDLAPHSATMTLPAPGVVL